MSPVEMELKENAKPFHGRPYPIPQIYKQQLHKEADRLVTIGRLAEDNDGKWAASTFIIPKKDRRIHFISVFHKLNAWLKEP